MHMDALFIFAGPGVPLRIFHRVTDHLAAVLSGKPMYVHATCTVDTLEEGPLTGSR